VKLEQAMNVICKTKQEEEEEEEEKEYKIF
jgi:hypothetical protein